jgi:hypothetical protein
MITQVEISMLKRVARDAAAKDAELVALPCVPSLGERKGNMRMQAFLGRLHRWCCQGKEVGEEVEVEETLVAGRHQLVTIGKNALEVRALVLRVSEIDGIDVDAWLDCTDESDSHAAPESDSDPSEAATRQAAAQLPLPSPAHSREEANPAPAATGTPATQAGARWEELLDHVLSLHAGIVESIAAAAAAGSAPDRT